MTHGRYASLHVRYILYAALALNLFAGPLFAQSQPYSVEQLIRLVESRVFTEERILGLVEESCLAFRLDEESEAQLSAAGASEELMARLREACVSLPYDVESIRVIPDTLTLPIGRVYELGVRALDADGIVLNDVPIMWTSSDTLVASVFGDGVVVGKTLGSAVVTAQVEGSISATMRLQIVEAAPEVVVMSGAKSPTTAAVLGIIPGGGELYTGNTAKGIIILGGSAAALAAGFLITSEESSPAQPQMIESCEDTFCVLQVANVSEVTTTSLAVVGIAVAGALWAYGLVDGIRTAKKSEATTREAVIPGDAGLSFELLPSDGIRVSQAGAVDLTLLRVW